LVERGPEKAGVGGSIPSLATILFKHLQVAKERVTISRAEQYANIGYFSFTLLASRSFEPLREVLLALTEFLSGCESSHSNSALEGLPSG
jgi:hypothetical protein